MVAHHTIQMDAFTNVRRCSKLHDVRLAIHWDQIWFQAPDDELLIAQVADMKLLRFKLWFEVAVQVEVQIRVSGEKMKKWEKAQEQLDIKTVSQGKSINSVCCRD